MRDAIISPRPHLLEAERLHLVGLRQMSPTTKIAVAEELWRTAWELKAAGIRRARPELSEPEIQDQVRTIFRRATA